MKFNRNSKIPVAIYYLLYLIHYNLIVVIITILFIFLVDVVKINQHWHHHQELIENGIIDKSEKFKPFNIYSYFAIPELYWIYLPALFFCVWGKISYYVKEIEINKTQQTIRIVYYPFLFCRKEIFYSIHDKIFAYNYDFDDGKLVWLKYYILVRYTSSSIYFYENKKMKLKFHDAIGWSRDQMKEICNALEKYKEPEEIPDYM